MIGKIPSSPLLQPQELFPPKHPSKPLSPPHKNSKIRIMKIGFIPSSHLLSPQHDKDDNRFISEPPKFYYAISYAMAKYIYMYQCDFVT